MTLLPVSDGALKVTLAWALPAVAVTAVGALGTDTATPLKPTADGLAGALLTTVTAPVLVPPAVGVKLTLSVHEPPAPKPPPQLLVTAKSPLAVMLLKASVAPPLLLIVTVCAALVLPAVCEAKLKVLGLSVTTGTAIPVPFKPSVIVPFCEKELFSESLLITRLPVRAPATVGEKEMVIEQLPAGSSVLLQVVDLSKSPLTVIPLIFRTSPPVLDSANIKLLTSPTFVF